MGLRRRPFSRVILVAAVALCGSAVAGIGMRVTSAQVIAAMPPSSSETHELGSLGRGQRPSSIPASVPAASKSSGCAQAPESMAKFNFGLPRLTERLRAHQPVRIVAIGSSSTAGAGASVPANSYPSRLFSELSLKIPATQVTVLNRGVNGEVTANMVARLATSVLVEKPDLVIWQFGANTVARGEDVAPTEALAHEGIQRIKAIGADVILYDVQYAPRLLFTDKVHEMNSLLDRVATSEHVPIFHRFELMRHWHEDLGIPIEKFVAPDALHQNDWSYACVARSLASMIVATVNDTSHDAQVTAFLAMPSGDFLLR